MAEVTVVLIGGPPGAGKTTTGRALAARLGWSSLTIDDIARAVAAMVPSDANPDLHAMRGQPSIDYFTTTPPGRLLADAERAHTALWPGVEAVITHRVLIGEPVVIDGFHLLPERIAAMDLAHIFPVFLDVDAVVLEERERALTSFFGGSDDPESMLDNFLGRSIGWNARIASAAREQGFAIVEQDGSKSPDDAVDEIIALMSAS